MIFVVRKNHFGGQSLYRSVDPAKNSVNVNRFKRNYKFWSKIEILAENRNFGQKSKFWAEIEILVKNQNVGQKSKKWSEIVILVK